MAVEIREVVLQAKVVERQPSPMEDAADIEDLKAQILAECKQIIQDALERRQAR